MGALVGGQRFETGYATPANSRPGAIANHANPNTKGAYTELIASSAFRASRLLAKYMCPANDPYGVLFDIARGAAGSEQDILSNVPGSATNAISMLYALSAELDIPVGNRISARKQSVVAAAPLNLSVILGGGGVAGGLQRAVTYGAVTADSGGTSVDPGAVANTKGAYSEITSVTTAPIKKLKVCIGNQENDARDAGDWLVDIAKGEGGSEQVIIPDIHLFCSSGNDLILGLINEFDVDIPTGTRLAARAQSSITDATDRTIDVILIGVA